MLKQLFALGTVLVTLSAGSAWAYFENHDESTLELKGFSPETIEMVQMTVDRFEGRYPKEPISTKKKLLYNALNNDWTASKHPFGYDQVHLDRFPKRD